MARAFYRLPLAAWPEPSPEPDAPRRPGDCIEVSRTSKSVYVLAAHDPHPALDALGAQRLGGRLSELTAAQAKHFTTTRVLRLAKLSSGGEGVIEVQVPSTDVKPSDTLIESPPFLRMTFAGDDPAELR